MREPLAPPGPAPADAWIDAAFRQPDDAGARFLPLERRHKVELRLSRFLRRERVGAVHTHKFGSNVWGALACAAGRVPVVVAHEHTWSYEGQPLRRFLDRELVARVADRFIAVSREDQRRMVEVERIDAARSLFVPIGIVDTPPAGGDARAELLRDPDRARAMGLAGAGAAAASSTSA